MTARGSGNHPPTDEEDGMPREPREQDGTDTGGSYTARPARREGERVTRDEDRERVERAPGAAREEAEGEAGEEDRA